MSPQRAALQRQREKRRDPAKQALRRRRKGLIEPVFARIKQALGFRRWRVRGLDNVHTQWALLCTASNLRKLYQHWAVQRVPAQPLPAREPGRRESPARGAQRGGSSPRQTQKENSRALPGCSPLTAAPGRI